MIARCAETYLAVIPSLSALAIALTAWATARRAERGAHGREGDERSRRGAGRQDSDDLAHELEHRRTVHRPPAET